MEWLYNLATIVLPENLFWFLFVLSVNVGKREQKKADVAHVHPFGNEGHVWFFFCSFYEIFPSFHALIIFIFFTGEIHFRRILTITFSPQLIIFPHVSQFYSHLLCTTLIDWLIDLLMQWLTVLLYIIMLDIFSLLRCMLTVQLSVSLTNNSCPDLFIHSFSSLFYDRSKASSKASSPHSAIQSFLFQMRVSSPFLKVI